MAAKKDKKKQGQPWRPATRLVHEGTLRSQFGETSEAIFLNSGYVYDSAEQAERIGLIWRCVDDAALPAEAVLASNTSSLPITSLAAVTSRPDRVIGMHFFNPVPVMGLIELVRAISSSDDTMAFGRAYGVVLGKTTVESRDRAGFIVNALLIPYLNGAIRMLEDGFATREDIDTAIHLGLNHPMGPLRLIDLIGLDTHLFIANVLFEEFKEPTFAPPPLLRRMVTAGRLGRKVGRGFYDYGS